MNREEITSQLKIKSVKGLKFGSEKAYCMPKGLGLYHPELGFICLGNINKEFNISIPYVPCGGRRALKEILGVGGLTDYNSNEVTWVKPLN